MIKHMSKITIDFENKTIVLNEDVNPIELNKLINSISTFKIVKGGFNLKQITPFGNRINNDGSGFNPAKSQESLEEKIFRKGGRHKFLVKNCQNQVCYCDGTCNTPRIDYSTYNSFPMPNPNYSNIEPQCSTTTNLQNFLYNSEKKEQ